MTNGKLNNSGKYRHGHLNEIHPNYQLYEQLKSETVEKLLTPAEYNLAIQKIAKLTGV